MITDEIREVATELRIVIEKIIKIMLTIFSDIHLNYLNNQEHFDKLIMTCYVCKKNGGTYDKPTNKKSSIN